VRQRVLRPPVTEAFVGPFADARLSRLRTALGPRTWQRLVLTDDVLRRALDDSKALCEAVVDVLRQTAARAHPGHMSLGNGVDR
jgi:hypothetical protein